MTICFILTSLGYGDIVAVAPVTRTLAYLEVIIGQFYMAVLVGALVGKYLSNHKESPEILTMVVI
ncbi:MAG: hypothetical protein HRT93_06895 [Piscirickettsiaceae bacterium]|nr:hypothetical protein [Piscirickettsiaceae bacterium]